MTAYNPVTAGQKERKGSRRDILTPEGIVLPVYLGERGERAAALFLDLLFIGLAIAAFAIAFLFVSIKMFGVFSDSFGIVLAIITLFSFLARNFYFTYFELRHHGTTPGKKRLGLQVINNQGGPLLPSAIVARNLMREVEVFLPISLYFAGEIQFDAWTQIFLVLWLMTLVLIPFFNRNRMRVGDMVGGTWVVKTPENNLLPDLAARTIAVSVASGTTAEPSFIFDKKQLSVYGIKELHTLETVLRRHGKTADKTVQVVARRVQKKINWPVREAEKDSRKFLNAYYSALRAHLESQSLYGVRKLDKHDGTEDKQK